MKLQSAMEYLMTYGWAILIIAIVLGVLYYLGIFSSANLAPLAQPGSCQVFRPGGAGTSINVALSGTCNNEMPEYVAQMNGPAAELYISSSPTISSMVTSATISFWVDPQSGPSSCDNFFNKETNTLNANFAVYFPLAGTGCIGSTPPQIGIYANAGGSWSQVSPISPALKFNTWYHIVWSYTSSGGGYLYIDGISQGNPKGSGTLYSNSNPIIIQPSLTTSLSIADIQIYNTSLSANEVQDLYLEGIGGAPINPAYVVGWWPLNGNPNDYSGNQNNGAATAVSYTRSWTSGYTAP